MRSRCGLPAVEVHLSDVARARTWRRVSVIRDVVRGESRPRAGRVPRRARAAARELEAEPRRSTSPRCSTSASSTRWSSPNLVNVRYLTGYTGTNGVALVGVRDLRCFVTDFRYVDAGGAAGDGLRARTASTTCSTTRSRRAGGRRPARVRGRPRQRAPLRAPARGAAATASSWCRPAGSSRSCARVKDAGRGRADPRGGRAGRRGAAAMLERRARRAHRARGRARARAGDARLGAERRASTRSSPPARTARCRTRLRGEVEIAPARLVTIDWGAELDGYCSDCTRTFAVGDAGDGPPRSTSSCCAPAGRARRRARRARRPRRRRRRARADRGGRPRRALRPRARPRRRARDPRGAEAVARSRRRRSRRATS